MTQRRACRRPVFLCGLILLWTISGLGADPAGARASAPAIDAHGAAVDVVTPLHVRVVIDQLNPVGVAMTVTCEVWADLDSPGTFAALELPANAHAAGGELNWQGDLAAGETVSFSTKVIFDSPGDSTILARARRTIDARNSWGDLAAAYLAVGLTESRAGFAPVPREQAIRSGGMAQAPTGILVQSPSVYRRDESTVPPPPALDPAPPAPAAVSAGARSGAAAPCPAADLKPGAPAQQPPCGNFAPPPPPAPVENAPEAEADETADAPQGDLTVTGTWSYYDRNDVYTGALEFLVELVRGDNYGHLAWCFTDLGGSYSCGPAANPGGVGVRTLVYSWSNYNPNPDTLAVVNPDWGTTNAIANTFRTQTGVVVFADGTHDIGGWYVLNGDAYERAYWTQRDLNEVWRYILFNGGGGVGGPSTVQWKLSSTDGTYYNPGGNVHMMGVDPLSPLGVVAKHEYGHNVMYNIYGNYMPPNPNCNPHGIQQALSAGCGWTEGWSEFLTSAVNNEPTFYWPSGSSLDLEYPTWGTPGWDNGDWPEGRVAGALWDIFDANDDGDDTYSDGTFANLWEVSYNVNSDVFSQWWASWLVRGHSNVSWGPIMDLYQNTINYRSGPGNDDFASATNIASVPFTVTGLNTTGATTQGWDPWTTCGSSAYPRQSRSVWYRYTPAITGTYNLDTFGSNHDTVLSVWTGSWGGLTSAGCNDDFGGLQSSLDVTLLGGTTYSIEVLAYGSGGGGSLNLSVALLPPPNDDFTFALAASGLSYSDYENTTGATTAGDDPSFVCGAFNGQGSHSVWYDFTPAGNGLLSVDTVGSSYDTVLAVFTGPRGALSLVACNDDWVGLQSVIANLPVVAGTTYHVAALGYNTAAFGALDFHTSFLSSLVFMDGFESGNLGAWSGSVP